MTKNKQLYWQYAGSLFLLLFAVIAYFVKVNETILSSIDSPIIHLIRGNLTEGKTLFFTYITKFGNTVTIVLLTAVAFLLLFKFKEKIAAYWLIINIALIQGIGNVLLKLFFNRERPSVEHLVEASGKSFPSGHASGSMLFYGTLIFIAPKIIKNKSLRLTVQIILGFLILLVGTSRIYVGVHYPTDIMGGFLIGASWLCLSYPYFKKYDFKQQFEGK
ncbi:MULTISPECIES: phosphatase PAP2 family protein [Vagococcus]|uniref:Membrane-associated phospholipid phosphatase n=1 Tax=Vagococcus fluvialis bH819 TaxID=1255619 RepID=A0A1X6WNV2_9ENTE|nr:MULTISPECIES: phosphatase PAP2 family protein [Vagococcus]SLM86011.1 Membrane-associated phospholipid phosphatase [Vagococcus fluvialis bH819]HCM88858.1 PAP2 family protein [Vagococcus sp.]